MACIREMSDECRAAGNREVFPMTPAPTAPHLVDLSSDLARHLSSAAGTGGIHALALRIAEIWDALLKPWGDNDWARFGALLEHYVKEIDSPDLHAKELTLRCDAPNGARAFDLNVCAEIFLSVVESMALFDPSIVYKRAKEIHDASAIDVSGGTGDVIRLALLKLQIHHRDYEEAIKTANESLSIACWCPYSNHYLLVATTESRAAGNVVDVRSIPNDLATRFCPEPFLSVVSTPNDRECADAFPNLFACSCPAQLPYRISRDDADQDFASVWNGETIREIRRSIHDGDYRYCNKLLCPRIVNGDLPKKSDIADPYLRDIIDGRKTIVSRGPTKVNLAHDRSCNLACPSCRTRIISINNEGREALRSFKERVLLPLIEDVDVSLVIASDGDPFFSKHYRSILHGLDPVRHARVRLTILTNGQLFTAREWERFSSIQPLFEKVSISIDAATAETYEDVRRPGKWATLMDNIAFVSSLRREGKLAWVSINFVVQAKNYREMPEFIRLGQRWGFDQITFIRPGASGVFVGDVFDANNVCDARHPEYEDMLAVLRDPIFKSREVARYTIQSLLDAAAVGAAAPPLNIQV